MAALSRSFIEFAQGYNGLRAQVFQHGSVTRIVTDRLPRQLYEVTNLPSDQYKIYGSVGVGNWAEIAWVSILDRTITETTRNGYYIVFLLDKNLEYVHLCLGLGWIQFEQEFGTKLGREKISNFAQFYASQLSTPDSSFKAGAINLHAENNLGKGYEVGTVLSKAYVVDELDDEMLKNDLQELIGYYTELKAIVGDSVLNLAIDEIAEAQDIQSFQKEIAQATFKEIDEATIESLIKKVQAAPKQRKQRLLQQIPRNRKFALYIKQRQKYICEICGRQPFIQKNGQPYAEADHVVPLGGSTKGLDDPKNMRCLCAQCHAVITHGSDKEIAALFTS